MSPTPARLALAIAAASAFLATPGIVTAGDDTATVLPGILVTAPAMDEPLTVTTDPKAPRQPLPAHDGADYLKTIPGFSVTRKGGTDGDAVFRGMAGSRIGILVDGENILGGCNMRMDAPTAYIYPELFDSLTVVKGAQTVKHGPGNSAATVLFERKVPRFDETGHRVYGSLLAGSFGRHDELVDAQVGNKAGYLQLTGSNSQSDDYEDGNGNAVHSEFHRYSVSGALGWTPGNDTRAELSLAQSDGEAAYADRGMDGTKFLRNSASLRVEQKKVSDLVAKIEASLYKNDVDHVMDDQTLRTPGMMGYANLTRDTQGGKVAATLNAGGNGALTLGLDTQENTHESRSAAAGAVANYGAWSKDATFTQQGIFGEMDQGLGETSRVIAGLRLDSWEATDERGMIMIMTMPAPTMQMSATSKQTRSDDLASGFVRLEHTPAGSATTYYAGIGQTERFPDYWELIAKRGATSNSAFADAKPEQTQQLDIGLLNKGGTLQYAASFFYNQVNDYLLVDYTKMGLDRMMTGVTRNIDASSYGGEIGGSIAFLQHWKADATLAYVRGTNETDDRPLAQLSPMESRFGLTYADKTWSVGSLLRLVDEQDRFAAGQGNIVGKDLGHAKGFGILSLNGNWKPAKNATISAGVDNVTDRAYAESVSRGGAAVGGYVTTTRVNEPGRTLWLKASLDI